MATEAQKRAQKAYMSKFCEIKVRMTPDRRTFIQEHSKSMGESATEFINRAIDETIERDNAIKAATEAAAEIAETIKSSL